MNYETLKELLNPATLRDILKDIRVAEECANEVVEKAMDDALKIIRDKENPKYGSSDIR